MNLTLRHNGQVLLCTNHVVKQNDGFFAYSGERVVKIVFTRYGLQNDDGGLLIDCMELEGGDFMNEQEKDKYGVIEGENVLTGEEKAELEAEMQAGNDDVHE